MTDIQDRVAFSAADRSREQDLPKFQNRTKMLRHTSWHVELVLAPHPRKTSDFSTITVKSLNRRVSHNVLTMETSAIGWTP